MILQFLGLVFILGLLLCPKLKIVRDYKLIFL